MIPISGPVYAAMTASVVRPALCVEMYLSSGTIYLWTGVGELSYNGNTYQGTGTLGSISSWDNDGNLAANGLTLSLSGIPTEMLAIAFNEDYRNRQVKMHIVLFNSDGNLIGGNIVFIGRIDVMSVTRKAESCDISVTVENHLISFDRARIRRYTLQDQKLIDPTDIGFEYISKVSQDLSFTWGSKLMTLRPSSMGYDASSYTGGGGGESSAGGRITVPTFNNGNVTMNANEFYNLTGQTGRIMPDGDALN